VIAISAVVYVISWMLLQALSRYREFAADRGSAIITGRPSALISALMKISGNMQQIPQQDLRAASGELAAFYIFRRRPSRRSRACSQPTHHSRLGSRRCSGSSLSCSAPRNAARDRPGRVAGSARPIDRNADAPHGDNSHRRSSTSAATGPANRCHCRRRPHASDRDETFGFTGHYVNSNATISFTASNDGGDVIYSSNAAGQYNVGQPGVGHERNGVFFN
jgi:hypothetical protein